MQAPLGGLPPLGGCRIGLLAAAKLDTRAGGGSSSRVWRGAAGGGGAMTGTAAGGDGPAHKETREVNGVSP